MVNTSTDHENNVMVVQILFLHALLSHRGQRKWTQKNVNSNVIEKTNHQPLSMVYTLKTTIEMTSKCSKLCSETIHLQLYSR